MSVLREKPVDPMNRFICDIITKIKSIPYEHEYIDNQELFEKYVDSIVLDAIYDEKTRQEERDNG